MRDVLLGCGSSASISLKWNVMHVRKNGLELTSHVRETVQVIFSHFQGFSSMKSINERNLPTTGRIQLIP
jgi:hypothetical protein